MQFVLAEEFKIMLVEAFDDAGIVAFESSGLRFVGRWHLMPENRVDGHVKPKAAMI